jgi:hypothetical protein
VYHLPQSCLIGINVSSFTAFIRHKSDGDHYESNEIVNNIPNEKEPSYIYVFPQHPSERAQWLMTDGCWVQQQDEEGMTTIDP